MATAGGPAAGGAARPCAANAAGPADGGTPAGGGDHTGGSERSSHSGAPTQAPVRPGGVTPAATSRSLPVAGGAAGIVSVVVSTARNGATRASLAWQPSLRSSRRTRAAAPRSESTDPLRPRVATRSAPSRRSPSRNATSVVAFPTSTPAVTVTEPDRGAQAPLVCRGCHNHDILLSPRSQRCPPGGMAPSHQSRSSRGQAAAGVDLGGLGHQRGAAGQAAGGQRVRQRGQLRRRGTSRAERLVDREYLLVGELGQLGGAAQVLGELRVRVLLRDRRLPFQRVRVDPQVRETDLAAPDGIEGELIDRPPGQRPDLSRLSRLS